MTSAKAEYIIFEGPMRNPSVPFYETIEDEEEKQHELFLIEKVREKHGEEGVKEYIEDMNQRYYRRKVARLRR